jgi:hypothetical protein
MTDFAAPLTNRARLRALHLAGRAPDRPYTASMQIRWNHASLDPPTGQADIEPTRSAVARQIERVMPALRGNVRPEQLMFLRTGTPGELQVNVHGFGLFGIVSR